MRKCGFIRKGYVVENGRIYNSYPCQKDKGHDGEHQFYHEELNLPIFTKLSDASLFKRQIHSNENRKQDSVM